MLATYLIRLGSTYARSLGKAPIDPLGEARLPMRVWPVDIDTFLHLNNGRYLTLMDFGRFQQVIRTGLLSVMMRNRWRPVLGAASVQFHRELRTFERFELVTRFAAWDEKWFYIEQRFEKAGVVHATGLVRGVLKQGRKTIPPMELLRAVGREAATPMPSPLMQRWIEAQESS